MNKINISDRTPKAIAPPPPALSGFEQRMEKLHEKGRKRGKWFSVIGIITSFLIGVGTIYGGYYLLIEVIDITGRTGESVGGIPDIGRDGKNKLILLDEWKVCSQDADCVETQKKCCDCHNGGAQTGINKQYFKEWKDAIKEKCREIGCLAVVNCKEGEAICEDGRCEFKVSESKKIACPEDAKVCPDGSSVGRVLPDCEFAECPVVEIEEKIINEEIDMSDWQIYRNEEYEFKVKIPSDWPKYDVRERKNKYSTTFLEFGFITNDPDWLSDNGFAYLWGIMIFTKNQYSVYFNKGHKPTIFKQNDKYIFTIKHGHSSPKDLVEQMNGAGKVASTFKFLQDTDNDGLFNDEEAKYGTDINNPDSDGDGYLDGDEVKGGYDPNGPGELES